MSSVCNVALLGQKFMGRAHSNAWRQAQRFFNLPVRPVTHTVVGLDLISLSAFADRWGWQRYSTNWKQVVREPEIHLVDISTPHNSHAEQALAALAAGKHVACEKPLAATLKDARAMRNAAVRASRCRTFVWFNYRRCPAVALARALVLEGKLGKLCHVRASYLQSWANSQTPLSWRFQKKYAGSGALGDLGAHVVDLARFITGQEITEVSGAIADTFVHERPLPGAEKGAARAGARRPMGKVDVDDSVFFLARFGGGALASFQASRVATGHRNNNEVEVNGTLGAVRFSFEDMNNLWYYDGQDDRRVAGWRRIMCTSPGDHPYAAAWWPEAHVLGYEQTFVNMVADMMATLAGQTPTLPLADFADAYETQRVLEAAMLSAKHRAAVKINEIK